MYGYIYLTTNLINNKQYIGKHKSSVFDPNYKGSGKALMLAFKKYGKENFSVSLLEECENLFQLNEREKYWIEFCDAQYSDRFYNIHFGGDGGDIELYLLPEEIERIRKDHSEYIKNRVKTDETFAKSFTGAKKNHKVTQNTKDKIQKKQIQYWSTLSKEDRLKRLENTHKNASKRLEGKHWVTNDKEEIFVNPEEVSYYLNLGYRLGRLFRKRNRKSSTTIESIGSEKNTIE